MVGRNKELAKTCARLGWPAEEALHGANVWGEVDNQGRRLFRVGGFKEILIGNEVDYLIRVYN